MRFELAKDQKRLMALGVVMAAAIVFCIYSQFMTHSKKEIAVTPIPSDLTKVEKMSEGKLLDVPEITGRKRPSEKAWGRNPFELPPGVELRVAEEGKSLEALKPRIKKVTAILITDSRKVASINHKVVAVGDLIDGEKVLEIKPDRVILEKGGRRHVIMLEQSPIQWTKNEGEEHE